MILVFLTFLLMPYLSLRMGFRKRAAVERILVVQTAKIGDWVCSTPVFRAIRRRYPSARLHAMVNPLTQPLALLDPNVDEAIAIQSRELRGLYGKIRVSRRIREGRYDVAVCLNPNVPFAVTLCWGLVPLRLSVLPDFLGPTFRIASRFFSRLEPHVHGRMVIETYLRMLEAIDVRENDISRAVHRVQGAETAAAMVLAEVPRGARLIGIAVSSGNKMKELGTAKIVFLCDRLTEDPAVRIVLVGSGGDRGKAAEVIARARRPDRIVAAAGALSLAKLPALLERLSLVIGVDTGTLYMADSLSVPVIDIAGPEDMEDQRPIGEKSVIIRSEAPCAPCSHAFQAPYECCTGTRECVGSFSTAEVVRVAERLLAKAEGGGG